MKKKVVIAIVVAVIFVSVISIIISMLVQRNRPENIMPIAIGELAEDLLARDEIRPIANMLSDGSIEVELESSEKNTPSAIYGKAYFSDNSFMLENFLFEANGEKLSGSVYIAEDKMYVKNDELLSGTYGFKRENLANDFENSIFCDRDSEYYLFLNNDQKENFLEALRCLEDQKACNKLLKNGQKNIEKYIKKLWYAICEEGTLSSETTKITTGGSRENVRLIILSIDSRELSTAFETIYEEAVDDDALYKYVKSVSEALGITVASGIEPFGNREMTIAEFFEEFFVADKTETIKDFFERLDGADCQFEISIAMGKRNSTIYQLNFEIDTHDRKSSYCLDLGKNGIKKTEELKLTHDYKNKKADKHSQEYITYTITSNSKKAYFATIDMNGDKIEIGIDKVKEEYKIVFDTVTISGKYIKDGNSTTIWVNTIKTAYFHETSAKVIIKEKDRMPKAENDFNNVFEIQEATWKRWLDAFCAVIG